MLSKHCCREGMFGKQTYNYCMDQLHQNSFQKDTGCNSIQQVKIQMRRHCITQLFDYKFDNFVNNLDRSADLPLNMFPIHTWNIDVNLVSIQLDSLNRNRLSDYRLNSQRRSGKMTYFPKKMFKEGMHCMIYLQAYNRQDKRDNLQLRYYKKNSQYSFHTASFQLSMCYPHKFCKSFLSVHSQENNVYSFQWWVHIQYNQCKVHSWCRYHL